MLMEQRAGLILAHQRSRFTHYYFYIRDEVLGPIIDHAARAGIQDHRQEHELILQADVGDVGHPELVDVGYHHLPGQIRVDLPPVVGIGGDDELSFPHAQQIVFPQDAVHPFRIHRPAAPPQLGGNPRAAVTRPLQGDALNGVPQIHVRIRPRLAVSVETVEAGPADPAQLHHPLDRQSLFLDVLQASF
jgi:hypothetical protein